MIIEGILTTEDSEGKMHVAPIGPWVNPELTQWTLKPFKTSSTFRNLHRTGRAIFHVIDDSMLIASAVLGKANHWPASFDESLGYHLFDCCHWYALQVTEWDISQPRATAKVEVVDRRIVKPFFGWNRAKHAVVEAAILASRVGMLAPTSLVDQLASLQILVEKTAGSREKEAFELLANHIHQKLTEGNDASSLS